MELREVLAVAWRRRVVVLGVLAGTLALAAVFALVTPRRYESTAVLALTPAAKGGAGQFTADDLSTLLGTYAETVESTTTRRRAEADLGGPLRADVKARTKAGTGILRVVARADGPRRAARAAGAVATAFSRSVERSRAIDVNTVDPPVADPTPVQPRPPLILLLAGVLGLAGGVLSALALEHLRRRIETPADVARHTPAPVLVQLPRVRSLGRSPARLVWDDEATTGLQERYRALRTNLGVGLGDGATVLEVTSPEPGQGKSTVVANLAVAFGRVGLETVVVDGDLRHPSQHEIFGLDNATGLSTALTHGGEPALQPSGRENVWVLTSGPVPPDPAEMLHVRLRAVLATLRSMNVLTLVDTPPVLPFADARLVAPHADGILLVVTAGGQRPAGLDAALAQLDLVSGRVLGVALNRTDPAREGPGGYGTYPSREHASLDVP